MLALLAGLVLLVAPAWADDIRYDWICPGNPYQSCEAPAGLHSWGSSTAVNQSDSYSKCSKLLAAGNEIARVCGSAFTVRAQSDTFGRCPYPNNAPDDSQCKRLGAYVGNNTGVQHGLRGVGYY